MTMKNKILIVEDSLSIREEILNILTLEGYLIFEAENGKKGLEIALKESPDLIISDVLMPVMDGFEMFKKLKYNKITKTIPFIFLSVKVEIEDVRVKRGLGAGDYLTKPITVNALVKAVKNII